VTGVLRDIFRFSSRSRITSASDETNYGLFDWAHDVRGQLEVRERAKVEGGAWG